MVPSGDLVIDGSDVFYAGQPAAVEVVKVHGPFHMSDLGSVCLRKQLVLFVIVFVLVMHSFLLLFRVSDLIQYQYYRTLGSQV